MKPILTLILAISIGSSFAQTKPVFKATSAQTAALKKQAVECATAMTSQNYKQMLYYIYPPIVQGAGGADKMLTKLTAGMQQMQQSGLVFKSVVIGEVRDIVQSKGDLYSIVQDILQVQNGGTVVTASSYVLAFSSDNGVRWYFTDTAPLKGRDPKQLFPTFPPGMVIPQMKNPMAGN